MSPLCLSHLYHFSRDLEEEEWGGGGTYIHRTVGMRVSGFWWEGIRIDPDVDFESSIFFGMCIRNYSFLPIFIISTCHMPPRSAYTTNLPRAVSRTGEFGPVVWFLS